MSTADLPTLPEQPRHTEAEWHVIAARREGATDGHRYDIIHSGARPVALKCDRCGLGWTVLRGSDE